MQICRDIIFIRIAPSYKCWYFCWFLVVLPEVSDSPEYRRTSIKSTFLTFAWKVENLINSFFSVYLWNLTHNCIFFRRDGIRKHISLLLVILDIIETCNLYTPENIIFKISQQVSLIFKTCTKLPNIFLVKLGHRESISILVGKLSQVFLPLCAHAMSGLIRRVLGQNILTILFRKLLRFIRDD